MRSASKPAKRKLSQKSPAAPSKAARTGDRTSPASAHSQPKATAKPPREADDGECESSSASDEDMRSSGEEDSGAAVSDAAGSSDEGGDGGGARAAPADRGGVPGKAFASAFSKLLGSSSAESKSATASAKKVRIAPELSAKANAALAAAKRSRREARDAMLARRALRKRGHNATPVVYSEHERLLVKTATRGVVALFNAVNEHQKKLHDVLASQAVPSAKVDALSRTSFLELLQRKKSEAAAAGEAPAPAGDSAAASGGESAWLRDDSLFLKPKTKNKLKAWDRDDASSDEGTAGAAPSAGWQGGEDDDDESS